MIVFANDNDLHLPYSCGCYPRVRALFVRHLIAANLRQALHKKKRTIATLLAPMLTIMAHNTSAGSSRYELTQLIKLALPLVAAQLAQMGMGVVDTIMAGRVGALELAGVALGGAVLWPTLMLVSGVVMATTPMIAQLNGAGKITEVGEVTRQGLWIALVLGSLLALALQNAGLVYRGLGIEADIVAVTTGYLDAVSWGVVPVLGYFALRYLCEGLSWTKPAMLIAGGGLLLKIPLNYWFVFGGWGIEPMGAEGCGWATALIMLLEFLAMATVVQFSRIRKVGLLQRFSRPDTAQIRTLFKLGLPIGMATFVEFGFFSVVTLLIGRLGPETVAAHQIINNLSGLVFMVPLGLGMATSIRVGFNVGAGDLVAARKTGWLAMATSAGFAVFSIIILLILGDMLISLYTEQQQVVRIATSLLGIVACFLIFDGVQVNAMGALRGFKDTAVPFFFAFGCYWLFGFPIAWALGFGFFTDWDFGIHGYWLGLALGLVAASIVLALRFHKISLAAVRPA
ncbi:MAG: MATE family efflux transporter [Gammaproteobacteria bacterium]|nr:MATE family efflux transporter [Gammaproteobacteria bacterium]